MSFVAAARPTLVVAKPNAAAQRKRLVGRMVRVASAAEKVRFARSRRRTGKICPGERAVYASVGPSWE